MQKYLFTSLDFDGTKSKEIQEISEKDLIAIRPVIAEMLTTTDEQKKEYSAYSLYGHLDGLETLAKYIPAGENSAYGVVDVKLLELKEIML